MSRFFFNLWSIVDVACYLHVVCCLVFALWRGEGGGGVGECVVGGHGYGVLIVVEEDMCWDVDFTGRGIVSGCGSKGGALGCGNGTQVSSHGRGGKIPGCGGVNWASGRGLQ